jgi:O-acetylhomoserine/O-acetylserine sulfhydrylase-like pyridoxal-dependent enzyme
MAITQAMCSSFKQQILLGEHDLDTDVIKIALYTSAATLSAATTVYSTSDEVVGAGYTAGGNTLTISVTPVAANNSSGIPTSYWSFNNTSWAGATFTARGALIYNNTQANASIAVIDFGSDKTMSPAFVIQMPANTASTALIRIE